MDITIPDLRAKADLLLERAFYLDKNGDRKEILRHLDLAQAIGIHHTDLSKCIHGNYLPIAKVPAFLRLFDLKKLPEIIHDEENEWIDLLREPVDAFAARIRLLGGESYTAPAGAIWDAYLRRLPAAETAPKNLLTVYDVRHRVLPKRRMRGLPPGVANPVPDRSQMPQFHAGDHVRFRAAVGHALEPPVRQVYVFAVQDIHIDGQRYLVPLFPSPAMVKNEGSQEQKVDARSAATIVTTPELNIPKSAGEDDYLELPANWGDLRTVMMVISAKPFDDEILEEATRDWQIGLEALDLLGARLAAPERKLGVDYALWRFNYRVVQRSAGVQ